MSVFPSEATGYYHVPQPNRVPAIQQKNEINTSIIITGEANKIFFIRLYVNALRALLKNFKEMNQLY